MTLPDFSLLLFSTDTTFIRRAVAGGVEAIIVDWERLGKEARQNGADLQINSDTLDDLKHVRACTDTRVICRINNYAQVSVEETELAIGAGADEILLPMVRTVEEVERVLEKARGRCAVGILVETLSAAAIVQELSRLPLSRIYLGMNDLALERSTANIFMPLIDGFLDSLRPYCQAPFGFGGLTLPERGFPIPCRLLIGEMVRRNCCFSFLRRSFHRDIKGHDLAVEIPRLKNALHQARLRTPEAVLQDRLDLEKAIRAWAGLPVAP